MKLLGDWMLIDSPRAEAVTPGGIVVPHTARPEVGTSVHRDKHAAQTGRVVAVGPGARTTRDVRVPPTIVVGDEVLMDPWAEPRECPDAWQSADAGVVRWLVSERQCAAVIRDSALDALYDRVIVVPDEAAGESSGGLILLTADRAPPRTGRVLSVGPGQVRRDGSLEPPAVSAGDRVMWSERAGQRAVWGGRELLILRGQEVTAVME